MWTDDRRARFEHLRDAHSRGTLSDIDREEFSILLRELDREEEDALAMALERQDLALARLRREADESRATEATLKHIAAAQRALRDEAHAYLAQLRARRLALAEQAQVALRRAAT